MRRFYVDLDNITALHPLVVAVRSTGRHETADGYVQSYVSARPRPVRPGHTADPLHRTADGAAHGRRHRRFVAVPTSAIAHGRLVRTRRRRHAADRTDRIRRPRPLAGVTVREGVGAHRQMLARIAAHFA